jgi:hypothetical protein
MLLDGSWTIAVTLVFSAIPTRNPILAFSGRRLVGATTNFAGTLAPGDTRPFDPTRPFIGSTSTSCSRTLPVGTPLEAPSGAAGESSGLAAVWSGLAGAAIALIALIAIICLVLLLRRNKEDIEDFDEGTTIPE